MWSYYTKASLGEALISFYAGLVLIESIASYLYISDLTANKNTYEKETVSEKTSWLILLEQRTSYRTFFFFRSGSIVRKDQKL